MSEDTSDTRERRLKRLFISEQYMQAFVDHYKRAMDVAEEAFSYFDRVILVYADKRLIHARDIEIWETVILPNFRRMKASAIEAMEKARAGDTRLMAASAGNLQGLSKDMDNVGWDAWKWWYDIEPTIAEKYAFHIRQAQMMGGNIFRTVNNYWHPGEVLDAEITGPIDEADLSRLADGDQPS